MKASDLRIGNLINSPNGVIIVTSIETEFKEVKDGECTVNDYNISELEPIPLTAEILESCGFYQLDGHFAHEILLDNELSKITFWYSPSEKHFMELSNSYHHKYCDCDIKYLQQLQNLYYCLTGTELLVDAISLPIKTLSNPS